jgi:trans-aconitate methyltransferase
VTEIRDSGRTSSRAGDELDTGIPQSARVYDYLLGGKDNFEADRAVGRALVEQAPSLPTVVRANRAFLVRAVTHLVRDAGVRQFLDIGTGIPTADNVHEVAQSIVPDARVLYVDNDPLVLAHARALMQGGSAGRTAFIQADLRDPDAILRHDSVRATLDRTRPIALMLLGITHHLRDEERPYEVVARLVDWLPPGSYLALSAPSSDGNPDVDKAAQTAEQSGITYVGRSREEIARFFEGLELVEPGIVPIPETQQGTPPDRDDVYGWAGIARKP